VNRLALNIFYPYFTINIFDSNKRRKFRKIYWENYYCFYWI